jgi:hypothetical protein
MLGGIQPMEFVWFECMLGGIQPMEFVWFECVLGGIQPIVSVIWYKRERERQ